MDYENIKTYLGEERLKKELEAIEKGGWLDSNRNKEEIWLGHNAIKLVDELIGKNKSIANFNKWSKEARDSKDLKDCLFELICINRLSKNNTLIIKQKNGNKIPDAYLKNENIYVEMTNLEEIPQQIELKVNDLCEKSQKRFGDSLGIHLVGVNGFFEWNKEKEILVPKKELQFLIKDLREKLQKLEKNIISFILFHNYFAYHPHIKQFRMYSQIPCFIFNGNVNWGLLKKIFGEFDILKKVII